MIWPFGARRRAFEQRLEELVRGLRSDVQAAAELVQAVQDVRAEVARAGRQFVQTAAAQRAASTRLDELPERWRALVEDLQTQTVRERDERARYAMTLETLNLLTPLKDAFLAARQNLPADRPDWWAVFDGLDRRLDLILARMGVEPVSTVGATYDPLLHQVAAVRPDAAPHGTVLAILRQGYLFQGRPLSTAQVVVSQGPSASARFDGNAADTEDPGRQRADTTAASARRTWHEPRPPSRLRVSGRLRAPAAGGRRAVRTWRRWRV